MSVPTTPTRKFNPHTVPKTPVTIPQSPFMTKLGFGTGVIVYKLMREAKCGVMRSPWAVKKTTAKDGCKEMEERLAQEANTLRKLVHPNIVGYREFFKSETGRNALAIEECGRSLGAMIEELYEVGKKEPFEERLILKMVMDISSALNYLHNTARLLHGDIKSFNVLIKNDFEICKLCDFGVCVPLDDKKCALDPQVYCGSLPWQPIETLDEDELIITDKVDIFSLGLTIWEMCSLDIPHSAIDTSLDMENFNPNSSYSEDESLASDPMGRFDEQDKLIGTRPEFPSWFDPQKYQNVCTIFYACTFEDYKKRIPADELNKTVTRLYQEEYGE